MRWLYIRHILVHPVAQGQSVVHSPVTTPVGCVVQHSAGCDTGIDPLVSENNLASVAAPDPNELPAWSRIIVDKDYISIFGIFANSCSLALQRDRVQW